MQEKIMVSPEEIENLFGIKKSTLADWRHKKKGPSYYKFGHLVKYKLSEFEEWMETNRYRCV